MDASFANNKLNRGLLFRCMHGSPSTASSWWVTDVKATRRAVGEEVVSSTNVTA